MASSRSIASPPLTDPALEFATLAKAIHTHGAHKAGEAYRGLAEFIGIDPTSVNFIEILGLIGSRSVALIEFMRSLEDDFLDDDIRGGLIAGVTNMSQIINPVNLMGQYNQVVARHISEHDIRLLRSFSQTARRHRPLRLLTEAQITELLSAVTDSLAEIAENEDKPRWAIVSLEESIKRLGKILRYFKFFGHDAAFDQLIKIQGEAKASSSMLHRIAELSQHRLVKTAGLISLAANLLLLPPKVPDGIIYYRTHIHEIVADVPLLLSGAPKQLTHQPPSHVENEADSSNGD